ncbi:hypothetical protein PINS_up023339 [Pythium insidiosum]|nr:hypothetical protein PINS_up023339 [Pythium insidiosum]
MLDEEQASQLAEASAWELPFEAVEMSVPQSVPTTAEKNSLDRWLASVSTSVELTLGRLLALLSAHPRHPGEQGGEDSADSFSRQAPRLAPPKQSEPEQEGVFLVQSSLALSSAEQAFETRIRSATVSSHSAPSCWAAGS